MTDGTNPPSNPQPEPAPGGGSYGSPPGPPAQGGYGYPPGQGGGYGYPSGQPIAGGYGYPQAGGPGAHQPGPAGFGEPTTFGEPTAFGQPASYGEPAGYSPAGQPDWQAMADRSESQRSRRKLLYIALGTVAVVLAGGAGWFAFAGGSDTPGGDEKPPVASGSPSPTQSAPSDSPTVPGEPTLLRDRVGDGPSVQLAMSPGVDLVKMENRDELRLKGGPDSFAQGAEQAVDVTKSFTVTTRVYTVTETGSRMAISQGDGTSYSFELGYEVVSGKKSWVFRVQTDAKGAAATSQQVVVETADALKKWTQLTATYDAEKKTIALYVDDAAAGQTQIAGIWASPGPVQLGRARHHGIWSGSFVGSLDRIRIWDKALTPEQVTVLDSGKLDELGKPTHAWII